MGSFTLVNYPREWASLHSMLHRRIIYLYKYYIQGGRPLCTISITQEHFPSFFFIFDRFEIYFGVLEISDRGEKKGEFNSSKGVVMMKRGLIKFKIVNQIKRMCFEFGVVV